MNPHTTKSIFGTAVSGGGLGGLIGSLFGGGATGMPLNLLARAGGGPVSSGQPYMVGERGPELFVPKASGSIMPNRAGSGGGGTRRTIVDINVSPEIIAKVRQQAGDDTVRIIKSALSVYDGDVLPGRIHEIAADPRMR